MHESDITFDLALNKATIHNKYSEPWKVTLVNTGEKTMTGGRLKRVGEYLDPSSDFCFTYGDGVSSLNIRELIEFHKKHGKIATITAVQPPGRYGAIEIENRKVRNFTEKPQGDGAWINGGFFVLNPKALQYIEGDETSWEGPVLGRLASENQMMAFEHVGFWQAMDTLREKNYLEELWQSGKAPWKAW